MRGIARLRRAGIFDGLWTAAIAIGGKAQALVLLATAGTVGGIEATGQVVLVTSAGLLVTALVDAGLTPQVGRLAARGIVTSRRQLLRPLALRALAHVPVAIAIFYGLVLAGVQAGTAAWWFVAQVSYGVGYHLAYTVTGFAFGQFKFRSSAPLNAIVRLGTVPAMVLLAAGGRAAYALVIAMALGELAIAAIQYARAPLPTDADPRPAGLGIRSTWRYGIGAIANTLMNKSDTVILAVALSATGLGVYSVASQTQNALTTVAMVPAGALLVHIARSGHSDEAAEKGRTTLLVVASIYTALALPVALFPEALVRLIFRVDIVDPAPLLICLAAGLFSVLGGVQMQHLTGLGAERAIVRIWIATAVVAVVSMPSLALPFGAVGAALGALGRDILFFALTRAAISRTHRHDGVES